METVMTDDTHDCCTCRGRPCRSAREPGIRRMFLLAGLTVRLICAIIRDWLSCR